MFDSDSEEYDIEIAVHKNIFVNSKNIEELKTNNIGFLKGDLRASSYYPSSPLIKKSIQDTLVALNEFDFLTSKFGVGETTLNYDGEKYHHNENRSYLLGLISKDEYDFFKEELQAYGTLHSVIYSNKNEKIYHVGYNVDANQFYDFYYLRPEANCSSFISCSDVYPELQDNYLEILIQDLKWNNKEYLFNSVLNIMKMLSF